MIVCVCHRVSDKTIERAARSGAAFTEIQREFGVATQCGKCEGCARTIWTESQGQGQEKMVHLVRDLRLGFAG